MVGRRKRASACGGGHTPLIGFVVSNSHNVSSWNLHCNQDGPGLGFVHCPEGAAFFKLANAIIYRLPSSKAHWPGMKQSSSYIQHHLMGGASYVRRVHGICTSFHGISAHSLQSVYIFGLSFVL